MDTTNDGDDAGETPPLSSGGTWTRHSTGIVTSLALGALLTGTIVYRVLEDWGWVDSFYFSVITLTTVGYGDFSPTTPASKLFTVVYIFGGISLIGAYLNEVMKRRARRAAARRSQP
jgi:hypothetical protein